MFELFSQLPRSDEELREHIAKLRGLTNDPNHQELFKHLYDCLSILDTKSSSLLAFNSIIIAVFAISMTNLRGTLDWVAINFGMASTLVSCLLLLWVVWIHWSTTDDLDAVKNHAFVLLRVRRTRTIWYRLAWYCSVAAIASLSFDLILRIVLRTPGATGGI